MNLKERDAAYIANTYRRFPVEIVSGKGSVVYDQNGKSYIDLGSGIAVTSFGISDDLWVKAVTDQISKVQHTSNLYYTEPCVELAELLCKKTGMKKVFFSNSGAESNECAIKAARKYSQEKKGSGCYEIATLKNSFHGRTLTTLAATGQESFHQLFLPLTPGFFHLEVGDLAALQALDPQKTAGIMIECVQGEGGVNPLPKDFAAAIDAFAKEHDVPLIVDEVQTGNGRTGALYSYMNYGIHPDVVSTAKGLAGGLPLGATLLGEKMQQIFSYGDNGSTFGANPVCCAAALSILSRIDDALLAEVREKSSWIFETLSGAAGIESVSGMGLMIGIKTKAPAAEIVSKLIEKGVLCLTAKEKVRLLPALNIPFALLKQAVGAIREVCGEAAE